MAATASSSHTAAHAHRRKSHAHLHGSDQFFELDETSTDGQIDNRRREDVSPDASAEEDNASLLTRLVLSPMLMISFLLSLFYVDHQNRLWRQSQHGSSQTSIWSWLRPEPYQQPQGSNWKRADAGGYADSVQDPNTSRCHTRKKHRKMVKLEFSEAWAMRKRVMVLIAMSAIMAVAGLVWAAKRLLRWMW